MAYQKPARQHRPHPKTGAAFRPGYAEGLAVRSCSMIEHSRRPLMSSSTDLDTLQRRANLQRSRHRRPPRSLAFYWQRVRASLGGSARSVSRLPARFFLHAIVALILPLAIALSQLQPGTLAPASQPVAPPQGDGDLAAPVAPL